MIPWDTDLKVSQSLGSVLCLVYFEALDKSLCLSELQFLPLYMELMIPCLQIAQHIAYTTD